MQIEVLYSDILTASNISILIYKLITQGKEIVEHIVKPLAIFTDVRLFRGKDHPVNAQNIINLFFFKRTYFFFLIHLIIIINLEGNFIDIKVDCFYCLSLIIRLLKF